MKKKIFIFVIGVVLPFLGISQEYLQNDSLSMKTKEINIGERKISLSTLNKKEVKEMITLFKGKEDIKLSQKYDSRAFLLDDGRLLLSHEGGGALYQSIKDLQDLMTFLNKNSKIHPLAEGIPYGLYYLTHIDTIIGEFSQKIKIEPSKLDKTIESLKLVDESLKELKIDEFQLEKEYLVYLMTYCGEVIRNKVGGVWTLNEFTVENKLIYEPVIRVQENKDYSPLWSVYQEIMERPTTFSLVTAVEAEIDKYKLMDLILKNHNPK